MPVLPEEIWSDILDYLDPPDIVSSQRVSRSLVKLARDSSLWRNKAFEKAPSATYSYASNPNALSALTGALGGLALGSSTPANQHGNSNDPDVVFRSRASQRAKAVLEWDKTDSSEKIDWYSEYVARHAPLSTLWAENAKEHHEIRGMALLGDMEKAVVPYEDGSLGIWDLQKSDLGHRKLTQLGTSRPGLLFQDVYSLGESSLAKKVKSFGAAIDNISIDSKRARAFASVDNVLNEIDLERMELVSQTPFTWPITALSQESNMDHELTVGTSFSLHIHDTRVQFLSNGDNIRRTSSNDESRIAFLENYTKDCKLGRPNPFGTYNGGFYDNRVSSNRLEAYARVEPGPQSILHRNDSEIVIAGRMPSILFYDRRNFPKPRTAIHSGARLSAMTLLPVPPTGRDIQSKADATLIACGEYGGRGSLEIYELPWDKRTSSKNVDTLASLASLPSVSPEPYSFRNRQEASSSKLLSIAAHGARIVFSDSEGMIKWVERDGRGLARRWNINAFQLNERGASVSGDKVVRKMLVLPENQTERGARGDEDILVWTGENIGVVTAKPQPWDDHDELVRAFERGMNLDDREATDQQKEVEYSNIMRRALERQADERRWMSRFGGRRQ